jgi:tetratricopeptide (TPR) repeat protein
MRILSLAFSLGVVAAAALGEAGLGPFPDLAESEMTLHHRAVAHWGMGMYETSAREFGGLQASHPGQPAILVNLGKVLLIQHKSKEALTVLEKALAAAPKSPRVRYVLARVLLADGRPAEAAQRFREAAALDPGEPELVFRMSEASLAAGRQQDAQEELRQVLKLNPHHARALYRLGRLLEGAGRKDESASLMARYSTVGKLEGRRQENCRYDGPVEPELSAEGPGGGAWLEVKAVGPDMVGAALVTVESGRLVLRKTAADKPIRFELGARGRIDAVRVDWPDLTHSYRVDVDANESIVIKEAATNVW